MLAVIVTLAGCSETTSQAPASQAPAPAMRTGSASDERACELAVTRQTNNPDVVTLSSDFSQANTEVILGVGAQRAKWRCLVSRGKVAEVMSLTNEGAM
jgi:hypothetical protein